MSQTEEQPDVNETNGEGKEENQEEESKDPEHQENEEEQKKEEDDDEEEVERWRSRMHNYLHPIVLIRDRDYSTCDICGGQLKAEGDRYSWRCTYADTGCNMDMCRKCHDEVPTAFRQKYEYKMFKEAFSEVAKAYEKEQERHAAVQPNFAMESGKTLMYVSNKDSDNLDDVVRSFREDNWRPEVIILLAGDSTHTDATPEKQEVSKEVNVKRKDENVSTTISSLKAEQLMALKKMLHNLSVMPVLILDGGLNVGTDDLIGKMLRKVQREQKEVSQSSQQVVINDGISTVLDSSTVVSSEGRQDASPERKPKEQPAPELGRNSRQELRELCGQIAAFGKQFPPESLAHQTLVVSMEHISRSANQTILSELKKWWDSCPRNRLADDEVDYDDDEDENELLGWLCRLPMPRQQVAAVTTTKGTPRAVGFGCWSNVSGKCDDSHYALVNFKSITDAVKGMVRFAKMFEGAPVITLSISGSSGKDSPSYHIIQHSINQRWKIFALQDTGGFAQQLCSFYERGSQTQATQENYHLLDIMLDAQRYVTKVVNFEDLDRQILQRAKEVSKESETLTFQNGRNARSIFMTQEVQVRGIIESLGLQPKAGEPSPKCLILLAGCTNFELTKEKRLAISKFFTNAIAPAVVSLEAMIVDTAQAEFTTHLIGSSVNRLCQEESTRYKPALVSFRPEHVPRTSLDQNHQYVVDVKTGQEVDLIVKFIHGMIISNQYGPLPILTLVVNGKEDAAKLVRASVRHKWPVIVLEGTGNLADKIASTYKLKKEGKLPPVTKTKAGAAPPSSFCPPWMMHEIISDGKITILPLNQAPQQAICTLASHVGDPTLLIAWQRFALYNHNAKRTRRYWLGLQMGILILGFATTLLVLFQQEIMQAKENHANVAPWTLEYIIFEVIAPASSSIVFFLSFCGSLLVSDNNFFKPDSAFIQMHVMSQRLLREIFEYRARAGAYSHAQMLERFYQATEAEPKKEIKAPPPDSSAEGNPENNPEAAAAESTPQEARQGEEEGKDSKNAPTQKNISRLEEYTLIPISPEAWLSKRVREIESEGLHGLTGMAMVPYTGPLPPKADGLDPKDDGFSALTPDDYEVIRLDSEIKHYEKHTADLGYRYRVFHRLMLFCSLLGTSMSAFPSLQKWQPVVTSGTTIFNTLLISQQVEHGMKATSKTYAMLVNTKNWWQSLSRYERSILKERVGGDVLSIKTEDALAQGLSAMGQDMNVLKHLDSKEGKKQTKDAPAGKAEQRAAAPGQS